MTDQALALTEAPASATIETFAFGDDISVIDGREAWSYFEGIWRNADWYEPPVPFTGLAKSFTLSVHHRSAIGLKVKMMRRHFVPSRWVDSDTHDRLVLDYLQMGNCFAEPVMNLGSRLLRYQHSPALHTRVGVDPGKFFWVRPGDFGSSPFGAHEFERPLAHIQEPDVAQEIYGIPEWLAALQSALLNEAATLFRRRYYINGGHAGYVFYAMEGTLSEADAKAIREKLTQAKGRGNFKNLFIHAPNGKKDGIQILPLAEVAAKDEFAGIKNITRDDMLAAHRTPPQVLGIVPQNSSGFGDPRSANDMFFTNEILPLQGKMRELNDHAGFEVIRYNEYVPMMPAGAVSSAK